MSDVPEGLKPYVFHGVDLSYGSSDKEALGDCPFCGREGKFSVNVNGKFRCLVCDEKGNQYGFIEKLWAEGVDTDLVELAEDRGISTETLDQWGVSKSVITGQWLVPGYNTKGELKQLYRYVKLKSGKKRLLATPNIGHAIHGVNLYDADKPVVYLCEGPWDAMKLWEVLSTSKMKGDKFVRVKAGAKGSLINGANVLAVPGCSTFHDSWRNVFLGKRVYIVYDNDHPIKHPKTGKEQEPAALKGVERVSGVLGKGPKEINYLCWGPEGYDVNLTSGTDIRDILNGSRNLNEVFDRMAPVPESWLIGGPTVKEQKLFPKECTKWLTLSNHWRKAMRWGYGLDTTLSVMLACIASTELPGQDQLWVKVYGPASSGKSTLSEALSVARKFVMPKDTFTGLTSGYQLEGGEGENLSLVSRLHNKTLIINDGDTLLQSANLTQILSQLRAFYGRNLRTQYKNKMSTDHEGVSTTIIVCGTSSLKVLDKSELGERFLDCVIMDKIDDAHEDLVMMKVSKSLLTTMKGEKGSTESGELKLAKEMTGGYVEYLRANANDLVHGIGIDDNYVRLIERVAKFVAFMRARPSDQQSESHEREFGARLVSQHLRLAVCLAIVLNRRRIDRKVMERVVKVALDTSRGVTYELCMLLYEEGYKGADLKLLTLMSNRSDYEVRKLMQFLIAIDVVEIYHAKRQGVRGKKKWRLTSKIVKLFDEIHNWEHDDDQMGA